MRQTSKSLCTDILNEVRTCKEIIIDTKREKNIEFMSKYNLATQDLHEYVMQLNSDYFYERILNNDRRIPSQFLYIFKVWIPLYDEYGNSGVSVYIKLCKLETEEEIIFVVSFHEDD